MLTFLTYINSKPRNSSWQGAQIYRKPYRMSARQTEILETEVEKMIKLKVIEPGESDFTSPLILVEVPGKEARPCIDYSRLNEAIRTQYFPLP
ncbi:Retrovirus-related Pol polyprotein from transposon 412, partial [Stegodyphus mimosarum]